MMEDVVSYIVDCLASVSTVYHDTCHLLQRRRVSSSQLKNTATWPVWILLKIYRFPPLIPTSRNANRHNRLKQASIPYRPTVQAWLHMHWHIQYDNDTIA